MTEEVLTAGLVVQSLRRPPTDKEIACWIDLVEKLRAKLLEAVLPIPPIPPIEANRIYNVPCTNADTEYSQPLPSHTKKFTVKARGGSLKACCLQGKSGTVYIQLENGQSWSEDHVDLVDLSLYFQSPTAGAVAEIIAWM